MKFLNEMAYERKDVISLLDKQKKPFVEHFIKVYFYGNHKKYKKYYNTWINTLGNILDYIGDIKLKTKGSPKLSREFYLHNFFNYLDGVENVRSELKALYAEGYDMLAFSDVSYQEAYDMYLFVANHVLPLLTSKEIYTHDEYTDLLKRIFK